MRNSRNFNSKRKVLKKLKLSLCDFRVKAPKRSTGQVHTSQELPFQPVCRIRKTTAHQLTLYSSFAIYIKSKIKGVFLVWKNLFMLSYDLHSCTSRLGEHPTILFSEAWKIRISCNWAWPPPFPRKVTEQYRTWLAALAVFDMHFYVKKNKKLICTIPSLALHISLHLQPVLWGLPDLSCYLIFLLPQIFVRALLFSLYPASCQPVINASVTL